MPRPEHHLHIVSGSKISCNSWFLRVVTSSSSSSPFSVIQTLPKRGLGGRGPERGQCPDPTSYQWIAYVRDDRGRGNS